MYHKWQKKERNNVTTKIFTKNLDGLEAMSQIPTTLEGRKTIEFTVEKA